MRNQAMDAYLEKLQGESLVSIGRASNMLWLGFGEFVSTKNYKGEEVTKSALSLHVQCSWRVTNIENKQILFASSDIYEPKSTINWSEDFKWDVQGNTLFDEKSQKWFLENDMKKVKEWRMNRWGDLLLKLTNGDAIEIFVDSSSSQECWRLFEHENVNEDFIITGQGAIFD